MFHLPMGVALDSNGRVFVSEFYGILKLLTRDGTFVKKIGSVGQGDGQFDGPSCIAFVSETELVVVDQLNHRIQVCVSLSSRLSFALNRFSMMANIADNSANTDMTLDSSIFPLVSHSIAKRTLSWPILITGAS